MLFIGSRKDSFHMRSTYKKMKNLFLRQSYLDAWEDYQRSLRKPSFIKWDYIILTASNEEQADNYRQQINYRLSKGLLPETTHYVVLPDPDGRRVGSGGATFNVLKYIAEAEPNKENPFKGRRILVIHSGGDSKRIPQYSVCGKLFSPVPRELPSRGSSTLFDEFIIGMSGVPSRIQEGLLVLSGDVLLLFNPLQIDFQFHGAAAISIKEHVSTGRQHGVFLNDGSDYVGQFLHKQTEERLRSLGAVNEQDFVDLDTGAVMLDPDMLQSLFSLISTEGKVDKEKFARFVNDRARISFYGDFLYPLAGESTLEQYLQEKPEGELCSELEECRRSIWEVLHKFRMKLLCLAPAEFIHFGTTSELLDLVTNGVEDYEFLDWNSCVISNIREAEYAVHNSFIDARAVIGRRSYIEDSYLHADVKVGTGTILSNLSLEHMSVPSNVVLHGLSLKSGGYVVRIYGIEDNPKDYADTGIPFLGTSIQEFLRKNTLEVSELWTDQEPYLWFANLYPVCSSIEEAAEMALVVYRMASKQASKEEVDRWKNSRRMSLYSSFNEANAAQLLLWRQQLEDRIRVQQLIEAVQKGIYYKEIESVFGSVGINEHQYELVLKEAEKSGFSLKTRIYYYLSRYMKSHKLVFGGCTYDQLEKQCFQTIQQVISSHTIYDRKDEELCINKEQVDIALPVRVNWGGGWTDTPPYCNEHGGVVLNAALKLRGEYPVKVRVKRLPEYHVEFESQDIGAFGIVTEAGEIQDCHNPYDSFALHKAALLACGVIPLQGECSLQERLKELGGGIYLSTQVVNVPKGSGLGTSSILAGACVKGIFEFLGKELSDNQIYDIVLGMEQIMSTGGGWQDQIGGLTKGVKFITSNPGLKQQIHVETLQLSEETRKELNQRFALIYTGQRRLARNLLREVVGNYIGNRPDSLEALHDMKRIAALMRFELEHGSVDGFANLLNQHWEISKKLDAGSTNTCIEQIFLVCEDLIDGRFIAGAGGGGFLQVMLKKGVTQMMLRKRLLSIFQDSGVDVWECELV